MVGEDKKPVRITKREKNIKLLMAAILSFIGKIAFLSRF